MGIRERLQRERAARRGNQEGTPPSRQRRVGKWAGVFLALIALLTLYTQVLSPLTVPVVETAIPSAQRLNYANVQSFNKAFKRTMGCAPTQYLKKCNVSESDTVPEKE